VGRAEAEGRAAAEAGLLDDQIAPLGVGEGAGHNGAGGKGDRRRFVPVVARRARQIPARRRRLCDRVTAARSQVAAVVRAAIREGELRTAVVTRRELEALRAPGWVGDLLDDDLRLLLARERARELLSGVGRVVDREAAVTRRRDLAPTRFLGLGDRVGALLQLS